MSDANKVLWSEGLFLRAQHFQQQDRHAEGLMRGALRAGRLQTFGFAALGLDSARLDAGRLAIRSGRGIFPDGTPFAGCPRTTPARAPVAGV